MRIWVHKRKSCPPTSLTARLVEDGNQPEVRSQPCLTEIASVIVPGPYRGEVGSTISDITEALSCPPTKGRPGPSSISSPSSARVTGWCQQPRPRCRLVLWRSATGSVSTGTHGPLTCV